MPEEAIPAQIADFLSRYIASLKQLEVLIVLSDRPDKSWTAREVFGIVQSDETSIASRLEGFVRHHLLVKKDAVPARYRYAPMDESAALAFAETKRFYKLSPVRTIQAIFAPRVDPAQTFADAFHFRTRY